MIAIIIIIIIIIIITITIIYRELCEVLEFWSGMGNGKLVYFYNLLATSFHCYLLICFAAVGFNVVPVSFTGNTQSRESLETWIWLAVMNWKVWSVS
jgi:hypothetical protein